MKKDIAINGMLAAVYAVTTALIAPIAFIGVQFRFSEILLFFAFYNRRYIVGLTIGCIIANLYSPVGILDVVMGSAATVIVCLWIYAIKNHYLVPVIAAVVNGLLVGWMLYIVFEAPLVLTMSTVALGEFVVVVIGLLIFKQLEKVQYLMKLLKGNDPKWN